MSATALLRSKLKVRMGTHRCSECGSEHVTGMSLRQVTAETTVSAATLSRFLNGKPIDSDTFDRLDAWVNAPAAEVGP